jgi:hypothetical protein
MIGPSRDEIDGLLTAITNINEDLTRLGLNYRMLQELTFDGACFMATCEGECSMVTECGIVQRIVGWLK